MYRYIILYFLYQHRNENITMYFFLLITFYTVLSFQKKQSTFNITGIGLGTKSRKLCHRTSVSHKKQLNMHLSFNMTTSIESNKHQEHIIMCRRTIKILLNTSVFEHHSKNSCFTLLCSSQ